ncbi:MAG: sulfatase-like hydrolase/transferase [Planctomycetes bacterium]|nr:sulfatase-like hydrolase/transferase [Planctomycetota bacterium]
MKTEILNTRRTLFLVAVLALLLGPISGARGQGPGKNILIVVADDVGTDKIVCYGKYTPTGNSQIPRMNPRTPRIDDLATHGVLFENAWSSPVCSPARACLQTGRYGFRTGIGWVIDYGDDSVELSPDAETILPEALDAAGSGYQHALIGKWHLSTDIANGGSGLCGPTKSGYGYFEGTMENVLDYYHWWEISCDSSGQKPTTKEKSEKYVTSVQGISAYEWIESQHAYDPSLPWFCVLNFNAPHEDVSGWPAPPKDLHTYGDLKSASDVTRYLATLEALDTVLGKLLVAIGDLYGGQWYETTTVIFVGDNGTPDSVLDPAYPQGHGKGTAYQGAVHVPLIVAGFGVDSSLRGTTEDEIVHMVDLYSTALALAGVSVSDLGLSVDSKSLVPCLSAGSLVLYAIPSSSVMSPTIYTELFRTNGSPDVSPTRAIRNNRYKLIRYYDGNGVLLISEDELYDLVDDPYEETNILLGSPTQEETDNWDDLAKAMGDLLSSK